MAEIQADFSKEEFTHLIKLAYIGMYVMSESENESKTTISEDLLDKLFQYAKKHKLIKGLEYENKYNKYFLVAEKEDEILEEYNEFIEDSFWDELIHKMARRDFIKEYGIKKIEKMSDFERIEKEHIFIEKYDNEFDNNGIENIILKNN